MTARGWVRGLGLIGMLAAGIVGMGGLAGGRGLGAMEEAKGAAKDQARDGAAGAGWVEAYREAAGRIVGAALVERRAWERLAYLCDHFPRRLSGSERLEGAVRWATERMRADGLENVRAEPVMVPHWVRGEETAELLEPVRRPLMILGLGGSIGTPPEGITAPVAVVGSFDELEALGDGARGKIVLFDAPYTGYGETVQYRITGASRAAKHGAVAALVRSVTPVSLGTPHTGMMVYGEGAPKIPAAAITIEDAAALHRMQARGEPVRVRLRMGAKTLPDAPSANVLAEWRGWEKPNEVVLLGGHLDAWDVGTGAHDDGGGCVASWEAVRLLKELGLRPRRTLRVVLFTNEENGTRGALGYRDAHAAELADHVLAVETDSGVYSPTGFGFTGSPEALARLREIGRLLDGIGAGQVKAGGGGADVAPLIEKGVPGAGLEVDGRHYFDIHHTNADTMDKVDPAELARCVATLAVMGYVVADMPERLPRAGSGERAD
jgi:carboxypeptidase Q